MFGSEIVDAVIQEGGFDTSSAGLSRVTVTGWVAGRYDEMVARARWRKAVRELGPTVALQPQYRVTDDIAELDLLRVGQAQYTRVGMEQLWLLQGGQARLDGPGGVFAASFDDASRALVELWPVPAEAGTSIQALCVLLPGAFEDTPGFAPIIPRDFHRHLVNAAVADGLRLIDERLDDADRFELMFERQIQRLGKRQNSRIGQGVQQLQVSRRPR